MLIIFLISMHFYLGSLNIDSWLNFPIELSPAVLWELWDRNSLFSSFRLLDQGHFLYLLAPWWSLQKKLQQKQDYWANSI